MNAHNEGRKASRMLGVLNSYRILRILRNMRILMDFEDSYGL